MKFYVGQSRAKAATNSRKAPPNESIPTKETKPRPKKVLGIGAKDFIPVNIARTKTVDRALWVSEETMALAGNPLLQLHQEIIDYVSYITPSSVENCSRTRAFHEVSNEIHKLFPTVSISLYGSTELSLHLPSSDIDISLQFPPSSESPPTVDCLTRLQDHFLLIRPASYKSILISTARVPILRLMGVAGKFVVELSVQSGRIGEEWVVRSLKEYPEARFLILTLKSYLRQRGLNDTYTGGIGSFLLYHLVLFSLKTHPAYTNDKDRYSGYCLGHFLMHFLRLYGEDFDYQSFGIRVDTGKAFSRKGEGWPADVKFVVECPGETGSNLAKGVYRLEMVRKAWKCSYELLCAKTFQGMRETPLRCLIRREEDREGRGSTC